MGQMMWPCVEILYGQVSGVFYLTWTRPHFHFIKIEIQKLFLEVLDLELEHFVLKLVHAYTHRRTIHLEVGVLG
jgi:hypothetical protein